MSEFENDRMDLDQKSERCHLRTRADGGRQPERIDGRGSWASSSAQSRSRGCSGMILGRNHVDGDLTARLGPLG